MSRKYNTKHNRTRSNYKRKMREVWGVNRVTMPKLSWLRKHQGADEILVREAERMGV